MRLISKVTLALGVSTLLATALSAALVVLLVYPSYEALDREAADRNGRRGHETLNAEGDGLAAVTRDWAHWDDTYQFAVDLNDEYTSGNLKPADLQNIGVDSVTLVGADRRVIFHRSHVPGSEETRVLFPIGSVVPDALVPRIDPTSTDSATGFLIVDGKPMVAAAASILTSNKDGEPHGTLIFTRDLDATVLARLRDTIQLPLTLTAAGAAIAPAGAAPLDAANDALHASYGLTDMAGTTQLVLDVPTERRFAAVGRDLLIMIVGGIVALGLISCAVSVGLMAGMVTSALGAIVRHMKAVTGNDGLDRRLNATRKDEIGTLARSFDAMIAELQDARRLVQEQSYYGGMADLAAGVLHNVRNAMSPMATALWRAEQQLKDIRLDRLRQAGEAIAAPELGLDRRQKFGAYIVASADNLATQCASVASDCEQMRSFSSQIEEILKDHDHLSRGPRQTESVDLPSLLATAEAMAAGGPNMPDIQTTVTVRGAGRVHAQRVVLGQVIGNLMTNAIEAIRRTGRVGGTIALACQPSDDGRFVEMTIADDGVGLDAEHRQRLFTKGYSTRPGGQGGIGLHWCANSIGAMGGSIDVESAGPGQGATFRIRLPAADQGVEKLAA